MNFLKETIEFLKENDKKLEDIKAVQYGESFGIPVEDFKMLADFNYDNGYGGAEIPLDLKVIGEDWWLERREYDGAEWWVLCTTPKISKNIKQIDSIRYPDGKDEWDL